ncbi:MAG TPA: hypothetical protein VMW65_05325, partial [Chloroflexota bacterium]|nr:hypothetical protein [Chloroflexota bacterium]
MKNSRRTAATKPRVAPPRYTNNLAKSRAKPTGTSPRTAPKPMSSKRISVGLVAASSAAIVAIFGFGYIQTQNAADLVAAQAKTGASVVAVTPLAASSANTVAAVIPTVPPTVVLNPTMVPTTSAGLNPTMATTVSSPRTPSPGSAIPTAPPRQSAPAVVPTRVVPSPTRVPPTPVPPTAVPTRTAIAQKYRDGTFVGQGYSRHGGVEAAVVIKGGRIISANVRSCSTRFPCSAIDLLPPLVVQSQSPPVDYVSGATDSSMA